jgi:hypothetical protein
MAPRPERSERASAGSGTSSRRLGQQLLEPPRRELTIAGLAEPDGVHQSQRLVEPGVPTAGFRDVAGQRCQGFAALGGPVGRPNHGSTCWQHAGECWRTPGCRHAARWTRPNGEPGRPAPERCPGPARRWVSHEVWPYQGLWPPSCDGKSRARWIAWDERQRPPPDCHILPTPWCITVSPNAPAPATIRRGCPPSGPERTTSTSASDRAAVEGVSLNTLAVGLLTDALAPR